MQIKHLLACSASFVAAISLLSVGSGLASAASIGVYSTGVSVTAGLDNNYQIVADTTGEATTPLPTPGVVVTKLPTDWVAPIAGSLWIGPQADESTATTPNGCCNGSDTYQTTFSLAGLDPDTAALSIIVSADDRANIWLNGIEVYKAGGGEGYKPGDLVVNVTNPADFLAGVNTLDFVVLNFTGSTGLDALVSGTASLASVTPEPDAKGLLGLGAVALAFCLRRKQVLRARQAL